MKTIIIKPKNKYTLNDIINVSKNPRIKVIVSRESIEVIEKSFYQLKNINTNQKLYGYNTGVADLCATKTDPLESQLQENLLLSHSCGVGENLTQETVRAVIFSRLLELSKGFSGVSSELMQFLADLLNKDVIPVVASLGSIGSSDLTILAQTFAILLNQGKVTYQNKIYSPFTAFKKAQISYPNKLKTREGLALINGNNGTIGLTALLLQRYEKFIETSITASALSLEGKNSTYSALDDSDQLVKPFPGNSLVTSKLKKLLKGSNLVKNQYGNQNSQILQDPLSFRCIPQNIGNALDVLEQAKKIFDIELNGVTDNPFTVPIQNYRPVSSGNFLCSQLATVLDQLSLVTSMVANAAAARLKIFTNVKYNENLPEYLTSDAGVNSGFMIPVYTSQSIISEIKALCYPRSAVSMSVANGLEDISTNAFNCALNFQKILSLAEEILPIEYLFASQAISLRCMKNLEIKLGEGTKVVFQKIKKTLSQNEIFLPIKNDIFMKKPIDIVKKIILNERRS